MKKRFYLFHIIFLFLGLTIGFCQKSILPPTLKWKGKSEKLIKAKTNKWCTKAEESNFTKTPTYKETMDWLEDLCKASGFLKLETVGISPQGRPIKMVIASTETDLSPGTISNSKKPTLLVQAGIHSGEIDGKDAGLMLLRDFSFSSKKELLQKVNLLFIPILNVDGHERSSIFNRPNQRGPENMGWRTNAQNLNLNRDYMKLDSREIRAVVDVINKYEPDFYMDIHVTDGHDCQYDITYSFVGEMGHSPQISKWINKTYVPQIEKGLKEMGHIPGLFLEPVDGKNFSLGQIDFSVGPNFSNGYADLRHLPGLLVETHSLKPYKQRVLGTYVLLEESLKIIGTASASLNESIESDRNASLDKIPVSWNYPDQTKPTKDSMNYLGVNSKLDKSEITNGEVLRWLGEKVSWKVPVYKTTEVQTFVTKPKGYWVPAQSEEVLLRLKLHGIKMKEIDSEKSVECQMYRFTDYEFNKRPFEGRLQVKGKPVLEKRNILLPPGSVWVQADQALGDLAVALLDPESPESFLQWGFFSTIFDRTEYMESYVTELLAKDMLEKDSELKSRFEKKKEEDKAFASNPSAILEWFYRQSPYADSQYLMYPVGLVFE